MIIYKTTNLINGKIYVGKDSNNDPKYLGGGKYFKIAIKKYGRENFKKKILEFCTKENINEREIYWIAETNCRDNKIGYNVATGGEGCNQFKDNPNADEIRRKLSVIQKEIQNRPEMKAMVSKTHKGRIRSKETCENIKSALIAYNSVGENRTKKIETMNSGINSPERLNERSLRMMGKQLRKTPLTEEDLVKLSETTKTLWEDPEYRKKATENRRKALDEGRGRKSGEEIEKQRERQYKKLYEYSPEWELIKVWDSIKSMREQHKISNTWQSRYLDKEKLMRGSYWKSSLR